MSGRQNRSAAKITKEQKTSVRVTRRSQQVQVLSDVSGNVPAETRTSRRKTVHIVEDVQKTVPKRPAEELKPDSSEKRGRKSDPAGASGRKTSITNAAINNNTCDKLQTTQPQKQSRKSAAMIASVQQMANRKQSDERKTISPKKRERKSATAVNGRHITNGEQSVEMIADSKEQVTPSQVKKRGSKSASAPTTQNIDNESLEQSTSFNDKEDELKEIIVRKYFHISERLRIKTSAKCLRNLINCSKTHKKNRIFLNDNSGHIEMYLNNNDPFSFLNSIKLHLLEGLMPKTILMQLLFELILGINYKKDNEYDVEVVLEMAVQTFDNILITFPPCWLTTLPEYRRLVSAPCKNRLFISQEFDTSKSFFENITNNLESLIHPRNGTLSVDDQKKNMNDSLDISFASWENKNKQKYSYDELNRDEKVERTFYALEMMIHLFEVDLQMWTVRHSLDPQSAIFDQSKHPLINSVLWDSSEHNQINYTIKSILKLFVNYVSIDFPKKHTNILSRLVNVAYNILELNELTTDNVTGEIEYPLTNRNGNNFCDTLTTIIYENPNYSVNLWLKVVEYVIHPKLKLHLISSFFTKIQSREIILNPKKIYSQLHQLEVRFDSHSSNDNNNQMSSGKLGKKETNQSHKYPFIQKVQRRATSEITYDQEIELCLIALNSYVEVRHIKDVRRHLMGHESHASKARIKSEQQELAKLRQYADLENHVKSTTKSGSFSNRLKSITENNRIYDINVTNAEAGLCVSLKIDLVAYRDDIKFVDLISPHWMPKLGAKFSHLFATLN